MILIYLKRTEKCHDENFDFFVFSAGLYYTKTEMN